MKRLILSLSTLLFSLITLAQTIDYGYTNPVLPGMHPDPSVCRVGDDFYLVNSSFQYFPGVPIYHSRDLIHWEAIGHCLTRTSQLDMPGAQAWGGIYAPTLRYYDGLFYMIVTNVSGRGNFFVTAEDPAGPWSDPIWIDRTGIDPDLFWDENGRCYVTTNSMDITEIDTSTGAILSEPVHLWDGSGGRYPEGPHIYKKDGWYYLMIAEGGTEYGHKETIARSRSLFGPYEGNPANPILTHACPAGAESIIQGTGHADMIQAADGSWWLVCLAFRAQSDTHHLLGRETFLAPVQWNDEGWPVVNGNGTISIQMTCPTLPQTEFAAQPTRNDFNDPKLGFEWNTLCRPHPDETSLTKRPGWLRLHATATTIDEPDSPVFVGRRQEHIDFTCTTSLDFSGLQDGSSAGLTTYMTDAHHYDLYVTQEGGQAYVVLNYRLRAIRHQERKIALTGNTVCLRVEGDKDYYTYYYSVDDSDFELLGRADTRFLSTETASGFTGIYLGLFAQTSEVMTGADASVSPAAVQPSFADFDWFEYGPK